MHVHCPDKLWLYEQFRAEVVGQLGDTMVVAPGQRGEHFRYASGRLERAP